MMETGRYFNIKNLEAAELERLLDGFPWYTHARQVLLYKLAALGEEYFEEKFRDSAAFLHARGKIYQQGRDIVSGRIKMDPPVEPEVDLSTMELPEIEMEELSIQERPKIHVIGGDYFSREDFEQLTAAEQVEKVGTFVSKGGDEPLVSYTTLEPLMSLEDFESPEFCTETLAAIYAEQGYYEQAIDVYAKLILLYPEKSTYFATLVNEIKLKKLI